MVFTSVICCVVHGARPPPPTLRHIAMKRNPLKSSGSHGYKAMNHLIITRRCLLLTTQYNKLKLWDGSLKILSFKTVLVTCIFETCKMEICPF